ncbi:MAG TPA: hypothetical protein VHE12_02825 [bacterium]|nr:hypothetical protein [bacterium]
MIRFRGILPLVLGVLFYLTPWTLWACPRCVDATPYGRSLLLAVWVILPLPAILGSALYLWIRKSSQD